MRQSGIESSQVTEPGVPETEDMSDARSSWRDKAECKGGDINQMFGDPHEIGKRSVELQQRMAKTALCASCEVDIECLEAAKQEEKLGDPEIGVYGLRGGMTERERRKYYSRLRRAKSRRRRRSNVA